jgi:hypothetical protein
VGQRSLTKTDCDLPAPIFSVNGLEVKPRGSRLNRLYMVLRNSEESAMHSNIHDGVRSLLTTRREYIKEAVVDTAVRDQQMSDNGTDSLYAEKARALRRLEHKIENKTVDDDDLGLIAEAILRYELNKAVEQSPDQVSAVR